MMLGTIQAILMPNWTQLGFDIDGEAADDRSGWSVSLNSDGTIVAIGAYFNDGAGSNAGHVRVYEWNSGTSAWDQKGADIDGEAASDQSGYSISLSSDGSILAIGAYLNDGGGTNVGHVRVYEYSGSSWSQIGADIDGGAGEDNSGASVSLSSDGTIVAIGGGDDGSGSYAGFVRLYEYSGSSWSQMGADIDGEATGDQSGWSVSLSSDGSIVAIGSRKNDDAGTNAGHVRVYEWNSGTSSWDQKGANIEGEAAYDLSGTTGTVSLSSDGSIVAIGGYLNDGAGNAAGHVRVYEYSGSSWSQIGADIDGEATGDQSGWSVSLSSDGSIVAIGAVGNDDAGSNAGHVRVYEYSGGSWSQKGADIDGEAAGDAFGIGVSLSSDGSDVAVGAYFNASTGTKAGHVRVYSFSSDVLQKIIADNDYVNGAAIVHVSRLPNVPKTRLSQTINDNTGIDNISEILSTRFDDTFYYTGDE
jgi:hypothetical protein